MSFIEGFYSFNIILNDTSRNIYEKWRVKTARHPQEPLVHLYARMVAFCCNYENGLSFSEGWYAPKDPVIWKKDILGHVDTWIEVGCPSKEKITRALKADGLDNARIYFYEDSQISHFCHHLRGSTSNWTEQVKFFEIDGAFLQRLAAIKKSSSRWEVTIVDNMFYLVFDEVEFESEIKVVDIWQRYQNSIDNTVSQQKD